MGGYPTAMVQLREREREREKQTDRQTDRQTAIEKKSKIGLGREREGGIAKQTYRSPYIIGGGFSCYVQPKEIPGNITQGCTNVLEK